MITKTGKNILTKYLIGQAPAYASYIAIGCGAKPVAELTFAVTKKQATTTKVTLTVPSHKFNVGSSVYVRGVDSRINGSHTVSQVTTNTIAFAYSGDAITQEDLSPNGNVSFNFEDKNRLDFEMFRVPIISRGYVNEDNVSKIVLTAELPSEERYEITEVGIFSAGANSQVGSSDSKTIYAFTQDENWEHHKTSTAIDIPIIYSPLDGSEENNIIDQIDSVFQTNADNRIFTNTSRTQKYERCRFFNNVVMMRGNSANLSLTQTNHLNPETGSEHIHLTGATLDFNRNLPTDELKFAFTVADRDGTANSVPDSVRILLEFASTDVFGTGQWARFEVNIENGTGVGQQDFANNRYVVATKQLQELYKSSGFTWSSVDVVKIYATVIKDGAPSADFYTCFDAIRLENNNQMNPLYGMTGYSVIKNTDSAPIIKLANTTNYIEFRFALDVQ